MWGTEVGGFIIINYHVTLFIFIGLVKIFSYEIKDTIL